MNSVQVDISPQLKWPRPSWVLSAYFAFALLVTVWEWYGRDFAPRL